MDATSDRKLVKILLLGDSGCGKTCLMLRYFKSIFNEEHTPTAGSNMASRKFNYKNSQLNVEVLELGGTSLNTLIPQTFHGTTGITFLYDSTNRESFANVATWMARTEQFLDVGNIVGVLAATKSDLPRVVSEEEAKLFAKQKKLVYSTV